MDFYKTLGVPINATEEQIRIAHRQLAKQYHPDRNPGNEDSAKLFKEIQQAYENLIDVHKRARYNASYTQPKPTTTHRAQPVRRRDEFYDAPPPTKDIWGNPLSARQREEWARDNSSDPRRIQKNKQKIQDTGFVDVFKYENSGIPDIRI